LIIGIGNDIVEVSRIDLELERRVLTPAERENRTKIDTQYVAGRFALKESYFKALGTGIDGNSFQDLSFLNRDNGSLYCKIHRFRKSNNGVFNFLYCALSHDSFAVSSTILEKERGKIYIGVGANLGDREVNIRESLDKMSRFAEILNVSNIYETKPYGKTDQPDFLNCVVEIDTTLDPQMLLDRLLAVENEMGRIRAEKWGPRVLDLDILFYGNLIVENDHLELPHYDFENRMFFVQPMCDLNKNFIHPLSQRTMEDIFKSLAQNS